MFISNTDKLYTIMIARFNERKKHFNIYFECMNKAEPTGTFFVSMTWHFTCFHTYALIRQSRAEQSNPCLNRFPIIRRKKTWLSINLSIFSYVYQNVCVNLALVSKYRDVMTRHGQICFRLMVLLHFVMVYCHIIALIDFTVLP